MLSSTALQEFKRLSQQHAGVILSDAEAERHANSIVRLYRLIYDEESCPCNNELRERIKT